MSQEQLKIEVTLLLSSNMTRQLTQQRMTSSDLESPFLASRAISAVAEASYQCSLSQPAVPRLLAISAMAHRRRWPMMPRR